MEEFITLEISDTSSIPKYKQIVNSIVNKIELGQIKYGQKLPSINRLSFDYYLARDTVEKAYIALKDRGIIESVKGKGYYVINSAPESQVKALVVFNKLSKYKQEIFNELVQVLGSKVQVDFFVHHCNIEFFQKILDEHSEGYSYYVIMPHFGPNDYGMFGDLMKKIPREKIVIMDNLPEGYHHYNNAIYQDFKMDIYDAMEGAKEYFTKYNKLILVFPQREDYPLPKEIILGFRRFCGFNNIDHEILNSIPEGYEIEKGNAFVVVDEHDLVILIQSQRRAGLKLQKDVGILSYNDTALKEVLAEGISVITTDFKKMARLAANAILDGDSVEIRNDFKFIPRKSL